MEPGATRTFTKHRQDQMDLVFTEWSCSLERPAVLGCPDAPSVFRSHMGALYHQVILAKPLSPTPRFLILSSLQISTSLSSFWWASLLLHSENRKDDLSPPLTSPAHCPRTHPLPSPQGPGRISLALLVGPPLPFHALRNCPHAVISFASVILSSP